MPQTNQPRPADIYEAFMRSGALDNHWWKNARERNHPDGWETEVRFVGSRGATHGHVTFDYHKIVRALTAITEDPEYYHPTFLDNIRRVLNGDDHALDATQADLVLQVVAVDDLGMVDGTSPPRPMYD